MLWASRRQDRKLCSSRPHDQILAAVEAAPAVVAVVAVVESVEAAEGSVEATAARGALVSMRCAGGKGSWPAAVRLNSQLVAQHWARMRPPQRPQLVEDQGLPLFVIHREVGVVSKELVAASARECLAVALSEVALQAEVAFRAAVEGVGLKRGEFLRTGEVILIAGVVLSERKGLVRRSSHLSAHWLLCDVQVEPDNCNGQGG